MVPYRSNLHHRRRVQHPLPLWRREDAAQVNLHFKPTSTVSHLVASEDCCQQDGQTFGLQEAESERGWPGRSGAA
jgi:hypothetical protein